MNQPLSIQYDGDLGKYFKVYLMQPLSQSFAHQPSFVLTRTQDGVTSELLFHLSPLVSEKKKEELLDHTCSCEEGVPRHYSKLFYLKNWLYPASFSYFRSFLTIYRIKNCRLQRDSNSDRRIEAEYAGYWINTTALGLIKYLEIGSASVLKKADKMFVYKPRSLLVGVPP